jgi:predicted XRE-type DNA-binding protein
MPTYSLTRGVKSAYHHIGFKNPDELVLRAQLVLALRHQIRALKLSQPAAAKRLGIEPTTLADLLDGHFRRYSALRLCKLLIKLKLDVEISVSRSADTQGEICVSIPEARR